MDDLFFFGGIGGVIAMFISWIWIVVIAFKESTGWGIGSLLLNPVALIYALTRAKKCKTPLILFSVGLILYIGMIIYVYSVE